jgi:hypothetical protein
MQQQGKDSLSVEWNIQKTKGYVKVKTREIFTDLIQRQSL